MIFDSLDGIHARATKKCSSLGKILDHFFRFIRYNILGPEELSAKIKVLNMDKDNKVENENIKFQIMNNLLNTIKCKEIFSFAYSIF